MRRFLLLILWCKVVTLFAADPGWRAGAADVDITPDYPVRLSGYGSRTSEYEKIAQRLHANALVIQWADEPPACIVTVDNCGVPFALRAEVLKRLSAAGTPLADERLSLHSTHTHCAPMLRGVLPFLFGKDLTTDEQQRVDRYTEDLTKWIVEAITQAWNKRQPSRLDWATGKAYFGLNRRLQGTNGLQNAPNFNGPVDRAVPVLRVKSADGSQLIATYASYACHCTTIGINEIHGDWAGVAHQEMELRFPGSVALIAIGCGADQNPYPRREIRFVQDHGIALAKEITRLINEPMKPVRGPLACATKEIMLPFDPLPTLEEWKARTKDKNKHVAYHAQKHLSILERGEKIPSVLPYMLQTWHYGDDLLIINLPGEVVVDYSLRFKTAYDAGRTWVNSYTNDVPCYIPSQRVWEEGGYEAAGAMVYYGRPTRFASGIENIIASGLHEIVKAGFKVK